MLGTENKDNKLVITLKESRVDMVVARKFKEQLTKTISNKPPIVVMDLNMVEYFDSSALGALVGFMKDIRAYNGVLRLCNINRSILTLLKLSKLDLIFEIFDNLDQALN